MFPNPNVAYKVIYPDGSTCYAAQVTVLDATHSDPPENLPKGVYLYLLSTNTIRGGVSFHGTAAEQSVVDSNRLSLRLYIPGTREMIAQPLVLQVAGRDQIEGDESAPGDFTDAELEEESMIQTILTLLLVQTTLPGNIADKEARGYVQVNR